MKKEKNLIIIMDSKLKIFGEFLMV